MKKVVRWCGGKEKESALGERGIGGIIINKHFINPHGDIRGRPLSIAHANYLFQLYMVHRAADPTLLTFIKKNKKQQQQRNLTGRDGLQSASNSKCFYRVHVRFTLFFQRFKL